MPSFRSIQILSVALLFAGLVACAQQQSAEYAEADVAAEAPQEARERFAAADAAGGAAPASAPATVTDGVPDVAQMTSAAATQTDPARRFIRTAQARFRVDDVYRSAMAIEDLAAKQGGFVVDNRIRAETHRVQRRAMGGDKLLELAEFSTVGDVTVRVPSDRAQAFLRELVQQMTFLDSRDFNAHDAQFDLLRQRLAYERGQVLQQSLGDAVQAGDRLDRKADAYAARAAALASRDEARVAQQEFEDRVAFATIRLALYQLPQVRRTERIDTDAVFAAHGPGFFRQLGSALAVGWRGLLEIVVALAALWPLWLVVAAAVSGFRFWRRGRPQADPPR